MKIFKRKIVPVISFALGVFAVLFVQYVSSRQQLSGINISRIGNYTRCLNATFQDITAADASAIYTEFL